MERTFAIIKPDAVAAGNAGNILALIEANGFRIAAMDLELRGAGNLLGQQQHGIGRGAHPVGDGGPSRHRHHKQDGQNGRDSNGTTSPWRSPRP